MINTLLTYLPAGIFVLLLIYLYWLQKKQYSFNKRILVGLITGIALGVILQLTVTKDQTALIATTNASFRLVGSGYLALLKMLVIPLILTSITYAIINLGDYMGDLIKKLSVRTVAMLLGMTALASGIGIAIGTFFKVGQGLQLPTEWTPPKQTYQGFVDTILGMLPSNPIETMASGNTVALVIFAVFLGIATLVLYRVDREKAIAFKNFISSAFNVSKKLAGLVIGLTPYGVAAFMAQVAFNQGSAALLGILNYIAAMYVAILLVIGMHLTILAINGVSPIQYFKKAYAALLVAFTSRSSFGTLPISEETLKEKFHVRQVTASFVPSLGATLGMNACAGVFPAMLVVMAMSILGEPITPSVILFVMFINMIASLGISGVPGTAYVAATVTLTALGLPYAVVGLVQGVDAIVDMGRTATNVSGALTTGIVVDKSLKMPVTQDDLTMAPTER